MQKTISSSCYDAIIIKQENRLYKSTPFQVVFSNSLIKLIEKNKQKGIKPYELTLHVNDRKIDIPIKMDSTGRVVFEKRFNRKFSIMSDSSDMSDDQHSQKSSTIDSHISKSKNNADKLEQYKNEQAPSKFWQFAWLFNQKKDDHPRQHRIEEEEEMEKINLGKIKQEVYEGEQTCHEPLFHLSLCGNLLKKKETKQDILKVFYENRVEYSTFIKDPPTFINDSNLVMKLDESIYTWQLGITILTCRYAYGKELSNDEIEDIIRNKFTKNKLLTFISGPNITKLDIRELKKCENKSNDYKRYERQSRHVVKYRKNPDSDKIRKMRLKYGKNIAKFTLDVGSGVTDEIEMKIFLWDHHEKIVISDIDGTITKSDILGQILSKWIHTGITRLFTEVAKRHYKIIYLTARAIGQYQQTSKFLSTLEEDGVYLPEGPLMMSPDGYYRSFTREVIYKTPDYLKTKILASLNEVFPNNKNPIYCGFGNRETDSYAYLKINISPERIFNITEKSVLSRQSDPEFASTYIDMLENIDEYFPQFIKDNPMIESSDSRSEVSEFQAVGLDGEGLQKISKAKSVDADLSDYNIEGIEPNQLAFIGTQSKKRNSEHQISEEDLRALNFGQNSNQSDHFPGHKASSVNVEKGLDAKSSTSQQLKKFALRFGLISKKQQASQPGNNASSGSQFPESSPQKAFKNTGKSPGKDCVRSQKEINTTPFKQIAEQLEKGICEGIADGTKKEMAEDDKNDQQGGCDEQKVKEDEAKEQKLLEIEAKLQEGMTLEELERNECKQEASQNKQIDEIKPIEEELPPRVL